MGASAVVGIAALLLAALAPNAASLPQHDGDDVSERAWPGSARPNGSSSLAGQLSGACAAGCLRCDAVLGCVKCDGVIVHGSRECRPECPPGFLAAWSNRVDYMGLVCTESQTLGAGWLGGLVSSGHELSVLVGVACGAGLCVFLLAAGCGLLVVRRGRRSPRQPTPSPPEQHAEPRYWLTPQEQQLRREFAKQVAVLRPEAPVFLAMLNDTRRKVRQLYRPNGTDSRSKAYRTVLRDLSRILTLLNRSEQRLGPPPADWEALLDWAERSLRRYKKSLAAGAASSGSDTGAGSSSASSTPTSSHALNQRTAGFCVTQDDGAFSDKGGHESIEVPGLVRSSSEWSHDSALYYDSYYPLGFRPQDEITTEL